MESFHPTNSFTISNNGKTATYIGSVSQGTVYGSKVISCDDKNVYIWKMHVTKMGFGNDNMCIGIDNADMKRFNNFFADRGGYGYVDTGVIKAKGKRLPVKGAAFGAGDRIIIKLNISKQTLLVLKNDGYVHQFENIETNNQQKYRMAVGMGPSSSVTFTDFIIEGDEKLDDNDSKETESVNQQNNNTKKPKASNNNNNNNDEIVKQLLNNIEKQNKEIKQLKKSNSTQKEKISGLESKVKQKEIELKETNSNNQKMIQLQIDKMTELQSQGQQKEIELKTQINAIQQQNKLLKEGNSNNQQLIQTEKDKVSALEMQCYELKAQIDAIQQENTKLKQRVNDLEDERKEYEMTINDLNKKIKTLKMKSININEFKEWDEDEVLNWIFLIENGLFMKYQQKLKEEIKSCEIKGIDLLKVTRTDIKEFGVTKFSDQKTLQEHIEKLKQIDKNQKNDNNIVEGNIASTAYI